MNRRVYIAACCLLLALGVGLALADRPQQDAELLRTTLSTADSSMTALPAEPDTPLPAPMDLHFPLDRCLGLTGTYGELRENHFHFGLDLRVAGWGAPVYAAADGYVSRLRVWFNGYGKALYLKHKDGNSSCYAHLERFAPGVDDHIVKAQFANQQFNQDRFFRSDEIPVKKGQLIGYAGSTGGSTGPHLHFEVRDPQERPLNPMPWLHKHIADNIPPFITRLAIEPLDHRARVDGLFEKWVHYPKPAGQSYRVAGEIRVSGPVGLEYTAYDRQNGAPNYNGVYAADLYLDDTLIHRFQADRYTFDDSRYVLQHTDHCFYRKTGGYLSKAYTDDGNLAPLYPEQKKRGVIQLRDDLPHQLRLDIRDWHGNRCHAHLTLRRAAPPAAKPVPRTGRPPAFRLNRQTLVIESDWPETATTVEYAGGLAEDVAPAYTHNGRAITLAPVTAGRVPKRAVFPDGQRLELPFAAVALPKAGQSVSGAGGMRAWIGAGALFDTTALISRADEPLRFPSACSPVCTLGEIGQALMLPVALRVEADRNQQKYAAHQRQLIEIKPDGSFNRFSPDAKGATLAKRLGAYCLLGDQKPPETKPQNFQNGQTVSRKQRFLSFKAWDDIAEINPWRVSAAIDGQWAVAEYYDFPQLLIVPLHQIKADGLHELILRLADHSGNEATFKYRFTLAP